MLGQRILGTFRTQNWVGLVSELIVVIAGIFIAFQVDSWWADQRDLVSEKQYIERLIDDVEYDINSIDMSIELARLRLEFANQLIHVASKPEAVLNQPTQFMLAVHQAAYTHTPSLNSDTFEELRSTGRLGLLRNNSVKSALFEYYRFDESERQYLSLQLMTEFKHFELAAGVLSSQQTMWLQDNIGIVGTVEMARFSREDVDIEKVVAAANRLSDNEALVAWLPESRGIQVELIDTHSKRKARAEALLCALKSMDTNQAEEKPACSIPI